MADSDLRWVDVGTVVLTRSGTTDEAVHEGRVVVEDAEPGTVDADGAGNEATAVAYREVIPIPAAW